MSPHNIHSANNHQTELFCSYRRAYSLASIGAGGWIRTTEAHASDLQSDPFGRSGTPAKISRHFPAHLNHCQPIFLINSQGYKQEGFKWSWREELNPRPADYKSAALPTELRQPFKNTVLLWRRDSSETLCQTQHPKS